MTSEDNSALLPANIVPSPRFTFTNLYTDKLFFVGYINSVNDWPLWNLSLKSQVSKASVKRATQTWTCNLFRNIAAKRVEKRCCEFYQPRSNLCFATSQVVANCVNTDFWLDEITRESRHRRKLCHLLQNRSLSWAGKTRNMYRFCCKKVKLLATFCTIFSQPATTRFSGVNVDGKTRNITFQLLLQQ